MPGALVLIFHRPARAGDAPLLRLLAEIRLRVAERQAKLLLRAGAADVRFVEGSAGPFGKQLRATAPSSGGIVVLGAGAVARMRRADAARLVAVASSGTRRALTNNRYSSDVCAIGDGSILRRLPALPSDNALPRWLEEQAGVEVVELPGRDRLALDIDTVLDACVWALAPGSPRWVRTLLEGHGLTVPRLAEVRALAADPHGELLVFGRAGSATLRWLEHHVRCRVRFLAEERGLRASTPLAIASTTPARSRLPSATLGMLLDRHGGPSALAEVIAQLADGAIIDSRLLLAHRYGADEERWPSQADRMASDLLRPSDVGDPWLRTLTESAASGAAPILLGSHTLVGPGVRLVLAGATPAQADN